MFSSAVSYLTAAAEHTPPGQALEQTDNNLRLTRQINLSGIMSRSDYPPGYNNSHGLLNQPQGGNYPQPPAYGFPSYGGPQPGQPSAPYPTAPNAPMFPGQPGGYAPGPYPGQPHSGGPPGAGYPSHPPMPPIVPPTIPSDVLGSGDEFAASGGGFDSLSIRHAFIRKVYLILASQLLVTTGLVAVFTFVEPVRYFVRKNPAVYWASYGVYIVTHLVLVCCKGPRRKFPWNVILLSIFVDFTKCQGLFCVLGIVIFVTGIITTIVLSFKYILWLHMLYAALGAIVFTMFLAYHTQLLIGNRKHSISPEEYVFAALSLYVDIIQIFLFLLQIIGASTK
ncbi:hypothetical protein INR49_000345 [Caranx melampygus]|nr:hypothetical protein INR49_000345 [Caranx melampygus]